ncbi:GNAT family N-acetyltransferase [Brevundimonas sp.]
MTVTIRPARITDVPDIHRLRQDVSENRLTDPLQISQASYVPFVEAGSIWVAEVEDRIVGFAAIEAAEASVWALFVDPLTEGRGIGLRLHQYMIAWSRVQGLNRLSLSTEQNTRAATFYARAGWTDIGTTSNGETLFELRLDAPAKEAP